MSTVDQTLRSKNHTNFLSTELNQIFISTELGESKNFDKKKSQPTPKIIIRFCLCNKWLSMFLTSNQVQGWGVVTSSNMIWKRIRSKFLDSTIDNKEVTRNVCTLHITWGKRNSKKMLIIESMTNGHT